MHWMNWYGYGGGWITMLLWWGVIVFGVVFLVKWINGQNSQTKVPDNALEILKKRYARGEITKKEFDTMKKDLG